MDLEGKPTSLRLRLADYEGPHAVGGLHQQILCLVPAQAFKQPPEEHNVKENRCYSLFLNVFALVDWLLNVTFYVSK